MRKCALPGYRSVGCSCKDWPAVQVFATTAWQCPDSPLAAGIEPAQQWNEAVKSLTAEIKSAAG